MQAASWRARKWISCKGRILQIYFELTFEAMATENPTLDTKVTLPEAYLIMFDFLEDHWKRTGKPGAIGGLLGGLSLLNDKQPSDPASYQCWLRSAKTVLKSEQTGGI